MKVKQIFSLFDAQTTGISDIVPNGHKEPEFSYAPELITKRSDNYRII